MRTNRMRSIYVLLIVIGLLIMVAVLTPYNRPSIHEFFADVQNDELAKQLTVYTSPYPKMRIGRDTDGGYIIAELPNPKYTTLLAGGINNDISFEEDFLSKYPTVKCFAFDGTIEKLPNENKSITFIKKNIGDTNTDTVTNLHDIIDANNNIFVKMDIEGGEIPWLKSLSTNQMNKFDQIVMEFHSPFTTNEKAVFDKLNATHHLIHIHGNNYAGIRKQNGIYIPEVFECTYLHKKYFTTTPELNTELLPGKLDKKNNQHSDDIYLHYAPFVH